MVRASNRGAALFLLLALVVPGVARAADASLDALPYLQLGPVIVHPSVSLKETYSDNVFYNPTNTKSDFITSLAPAVTLKLPFSMQELSFGAGGEFRRYAEFTSLDVTPYFVFGLGDFTIGDRVKLKIGDTYELNEESPLESPTGTADEYTENRAAFSVKYAFVDVSQIQLDYTRTTLDYRDSAYRTRDEDLISVYLYYRVQPATSVFLEYDFKTVAYDTTTTLDNDVNIGHVGAIWEFTEYSKGTAKAGFLSKNYSDASLEDFSTWTASVDLQHDLSDAASVRLLGKRDVNEGKHRGVRYYTTSGLFVDFRYRFLDRLTGVLEGSYSLDTFSDPQAGRSDVREDATVRAGVGAKYSFNSWLDLTLDYSYLQRDSNYDSADATVNAIIFGVTAYR